MMQTILPPNRTDAEEALDLAVAARIEGVPVPVATLWDPETCPASHLRHLAWALSVEDWDEEWPEATKRAVIAASVDVHRKKGTPAGVRAAMTAMGYGSAEIVEASDYPQLGGPSVTGARYPLGRLWRLGDAGMALGPAPRATRERARPLGRAWRLGKPGHWAEYLVRVYQVISKADADALASRLAKVAPARCRLSAIVFAGVRHELGAGVWALGQNIPLGGSYIYEDIANG
ncbi:phage tail protein I [Maritimibacter sp. HL-12]|uniref:phage tail protein I n=1 Tax=Maritimibacter sp. HL-12 TaxID=1162418 RepID=UPI0015945634|nr:phage tail protein I [Maritimibacter sp. HL-12]